MRSDLLCENLAKFFFFKDFTKKILLKRQKIKATVMRTLEDKYDRVLIDKKLSKK
jgi:hypothetical protein